MKNIKPKKAFNGSEGSAIYMSNARSSISSSKVPGMEKTLTAPSDCRKAISIRAANHIEQRLMQREDGQESQCADDVGLQSIKQENERLLAALTNKANFKLKVDVDDYLIRTKEKDQSVLDIDKKRNDALCDHRIPGHEKFCSRDKCISEPVGAGPKHNSVNSGADPNNLNPKLESKSTAYSEQITSGPRVSSVVDSFKSHVARVSSSSESDRRPGMKERLFQDDGDKCMRAATAGSFASARSALEDKIFLEKIMQQSNRDAMRIFSNLDQTRKWRVLPLLPKNLVDAILAEMSAKDRKYGHHILAENERVSTCGIGGMDRTKSMPDKKIASRVTELQNGQKHCNSSYAPIAAHRSACEGISVTASITEPGTDHLRLSPRKSSRRASDIGANASACLATIDGAVLTADLVQNNRRFSTPGDLSVFRSIEERIYGIEGIKPLSHPQEPLGNSIATHRACRKSETVTSTQHHPRAHFVDNMCPFTRKSDSPPSRPPPLRPAPRTQNEAGFQTGSTGTANDSRPATPPNRPLPTPPSGPATQKRSMGVAPPDRPLPNIPRKQPEVKVWRLAEGAPSPLLLDEESQEDDTSLFALSTDGRSTVTSTLLCTNQSAGLESEDKVLLPVKEFLPRTEWSTISLLSSDDDSEDGLPISSGNNKNSAVSNHEFATPCPLENSDGPQHNFTFGSSMVEGCAVSEQLSFRSFSACSESRELPWTAWVRKNTGAASQTRAVYKNDYAEVLANVSRSRTYSSCYELQPTFLASVNLSGPDLRASRKVLIKNMLRRERELTRLRSPSGARMNYLC